jgi:hypothetical protein
MKPNKKSSSKSCEDEKKEAQELLHDVKIINRDITNYSESQKNKKQIHAFEKEIDDMCKDKN